MRKRLKGIARKVRRSGIMLPLSFTLKVRSKSAKSRGFQQIKIMGTTQLLPTKGVEKEYLCLKIRLIFQK